MSKRTPLNGDPCICGDKATWHKECYRRAQAVAYEPVAWISEYGKDGYAGAARRVFLEDPSTMYPNSRITPLYASPPAQPDPLTDARIDERIDAAVAAERERIAAHFDARDKGVGGFYDAHEPAEIIRAMTQG